MVQVQMSQISVAEDVEGGMVEVCLVKANEVELQNAVNVLVSTGAGPINDGVDSTTGERELSYIM